MSPPLSTENNAGAQTSPAQGPPGPFHTSWAGGRPPLPLWGLGDGASLRYPTCRRRLRFPETVPMRPHAHTGEGLQQPLPLPIQFSGRSVLLKKPQGWTDSFKLSCNCPDLRDKGGSWTQNLPVPILADSSLAAAWAGAPVSPAVIFLLSKDVFISDKKCLQHRPKMMHARDPGYQGSVLSPSLQEDSPGPARRGPAPRKPRPLRPRPTKAPPRPAEAPPRRGQGQSGPQKR